MKTIPSRVSLFIVIFAVLSPSSVAQVSRGVQGGVLGDHATNQLPDVSGNGPASRTMLAFRQPSPIEAKAGSMPTHYCLRGYENERLLPS